MDVANATPVRTLLVSDVHLGCKHSQSRKFLTFLRQFKPESLYIVGDFIDTWKINTGWYWPRDCDEIISHLVTLSQQGTKIHYVPGNHDSFLRNPALRAFLPIDLPKFEVGNEFVFETLGGWRFLVTHGDLFDVFETRAQWASRGSSVFYDACLSANWWFHRMLLGEDRNPYGICAILKDRVKRCVRFISSYEAKILQHARVRDCNGVICGHIHTPDIVSNDSMVYCNTGDWVENCTALVESNDGRIHLLQRYGEDVLLDLPNRKPPLEPCLENEMAEEVAA